MGQLRALHCQYEITFYSKCDIDSQSVLLLKGRFTVPTQMSILCPILWIVSSNDNLA